MAAAKKSGKKIPAKSQIRGQKSTGTGKGKKAEPAPVVVVPKKRGHPPIPYDPHRHPEWVRGLASRGSTVPQICTAMGVSRGTLYAWRDKYPDFLAALQVGRNETIALLHNSLVKSALGHSIHTTKVEKFGDGTMSKITEMDEYFPPNTGAAKILLVNLDPTFKTERTENQNTNNTESTIIILPDNGRDKPATPGKKNN